MWAKYTYVYIWKMKQQVHNREKGFLLGIHLKPRLHLTIYYNYRMHLRSKNRDKTSITSNERERRKEKERGYSAKYEEGGRVGDVNYFLTHPKKEKKKEEVEQGQKSN